ncbi:MAG: hypothetical protein V7752_20730 [Halopseudomonas sp.]
MNYQLNVDAPNYNWWKPVGFHLACSSRNSNMSPSGWLAGLIAMRAAKGASVLVVERLPRLQSYMKGLGLLLSENVEFKTTSDPTVYRDYDAELLVFTGVDVGLLCSTKLERRFRSDREVVFECEYAPLQDRILDQIFGPVFDTISVLPGAFDSYRGVESLALSEKAERIASVFESTPLEQPAGHTDSIRFHASGEVSLCRSVTPTEGTFFNSQLSSGDSHETGHP